MADPRIQVHGHRHMTSDVLLTLSDGVWIGLLIIGVIVVLIMIARD